MDLWEGSKFLSASVGPPDICADGWKLLGISLEAVGRVDEAERALAKAMELAPGQLLVLYARGRCLQVKRSTLLLPLLQWSLFAKCSVLSLDTCRRFAGTCGGLSRWVGVSACVVVIQSCHPKHLHTYSHTRVSV